VTRRIATTSAETAARYQAERNRKIAGARMGILSPAYATDGIKIPRRKRRVLLDLAPHTVEILLDAMERASRNDDLNRHDVTRRMLVEALEKAEKAR
jgi:hypothetical protein